MPTKTEIIIKMTKHGIFTNSEIAKAANCRLFYVSKVQRLHADPEYRARHNAENKKLMAKVYSANPEQGAARKQAYLARKREASNAQA